MNASSSTSLTTVPSTGGISKAHGFVQQNFDLLPDKYALQAMQMARYNELNNPRSAGQTSTHETNNRSSAYIDRGYHNYFLASNEYQATNSSKLQHKMKQPSNFAAKMGQQPGINQSAMANSHNNSMLSSTEQQPFERIPHMAVQNSSSQYLIAKSKAVMESN